jgi:CheY-like chemotaxis protein
MKDHTIMIVDDAPDNLLLLEMMLEERFEIIQAESGQACLDLVAQNIPDLILLDVNMPGMTGYEVCTKLRTDPVTSNLPILFVSAMINTEERLAGFEAGGDEYINKPVDEKELLDKIDFQLAAVKERKKGQQDAAEAMQVAMVAMTSSSELGQLIAFVTEAQNASTLDDMGKMVIKVCESFGLNACAYIQGGKSEFYGCDANSVEATVLQRSVTSTERIINLGIRTIVKSDQVSLLIKNMPVEDENKYGRFKDHLAVLISISDGRIMTLKAQLDVAGQRKDVLARVIMHTETQIKSLNSKILKYDENSRELMMNMIRQLETTLFSLGLDEDQEESLMSLVYGTSNDLEKSKEVTKQLQDELGSVLEGLYEILAKND